MNVERTISAAFLDSLLHAAQQLGLDKGTLLQSSQLDLTFLKPPTKRISENAMHRLLEKIVELSGKEEIGLELGRLSRPGSYNALGYAAMSCENLWEAFSLIPRYEVIVMEIGRTRIEKSEHEIKLVWGSSEPEAVSRALADTILSSWLSLARWLTAEPLRPSKTLLSYCKPDESKVYEDFFGSEVIFDSGENAFIFEDASLLEKPIIHADSTMSAIMRERAQQLKADIPHQQSAAARVEAILEKQLALGVSSIKDVANQLHMSERTLRRRLQDEKANFQNLLTNTRKRLASTYLLDHSLSILDIALLLGYSEHSSFSAAFKNWCDESPQDYRTRLTDQSEQAKKRV